jgi:hypothetical protein
MAQNVDFINPQFKKINILGQRKGDMPAILTVFIHFIITHAPGKKQLLYLST